MVPDKLITADCHITPPLSIVNELPEHYREYFPRIEKNENGKDVYKLSDQKMPEKFAAQKVTVKGALDNTTKTIHVDSITAAK